MHGELDGWLSSAVIDLTMPFASGTSCLSGKPTLPSVHVDAPSIPAHANEV
jgi:hypothetical protein